MIRSFVLAWKKPFDFRSKTSRKDFWFYELATIILFLVISVLQNIITNLQYAFIESASLISEIFAVVGQTISILSFLFTLGSLIIGISRYFLNSSTFLWESVLTIRISAY